MNDGNAAAEREEDLRNAEWEMARPTDSQKVIWMRAETIQYLIKLQKCGELQEWLLDALGNTPQVRWKSFEDAILENNDEKIGRLLMKLFSALTIAVQRVHSTITISAEDAMVSWECTLFIPKENFVETYHGITPAAPLNIAFFCSTCGDIWARAFCHSGSWFCQSVPCRQHEFQSPEDANTVPGSIISDAFDPPLSATLRNRNVKYLPETILKREFEIHLAYYDKLRNQS